MDFKEANKTVHPVEKQWHYAALTEHGFEPIDKEGIGFVRSYRYERKGGFGCKTVTITCTTGCNADYWKNETTGDGGYWADLRPYLGKLFEQIKEEENV